MIAVAEAELRGHYKTLAPWSRAFEIPDVLDYSDHCFCATKPEMSQLLELPDRRP